jgi:hypothetical protein
VLSGRALLSPQELWSESIALCVRNTAGAPGMD